MQFGLNAVVEQSLFWNFGQTVAAAEGFDSDTTWLEGYIKPGLTVSKSLGGDRLLYGGLSTVLSGTLGVDAFDVGNTGRITLEEGYVGVRAGDEDGGRFVDLSVGPREYVAGTGMLIANGGASGFDRGALKLGPHRAWEFAALGRAGFGGGLTATAFYLDANELPHSDSETAIAGLDLRWDGPDDSFAGVTLGRAPRSTAPYPKAAPDGVGAPTILTGARQGLSFVNLYGRAQPFSGRLKPLFVAGDLALERNHDIDMKAWAGRVQVGYVFDHPWRPTLMYAYQTFSGDDPSTAGLERFDPLYYEGSPSSWSTGSKSSMVFINSNINAHQLTLRVTPTPRDTVTLRYAHIRANALRSPIQYGQGTRAEPSDGGFTLVAGVTAHDLSDDLFLEYNRALRPNIYLTFGVSISMPGEGIDTVVEEDAPYWTGAFINLVANF